MKINSYMSLAIVLLSFLSCKKFIEVDPPTNKVVSETVFTTDATATAAINGLFSTFANGSSSDFPSGGSTIYLGMYSDELKTTLTTASVIEFQDSKLSTTNSVVNLNFWRKAYNLINIANSCISGLEKSQITPQLRAQLLGEAYFVRSFCYWNLVTLFGDVPLVTNVGDYNNVAQMPRTPSDVVIARVLADLSESKSRLKPVYPSAGRFRPNYFTVLAMLSRVHTYLGNWNDALVLSNDVIGSPMYQMEADPNKVFLIGSTEAVWQTISDVEGNNSTEGAVLVPNTLVTTIPQYVLQQSLIDSFETLDKRKTSWMNNKTVAGNIYTYPYKYKVRFNVVKTECQMMLRLAEVYLNRAEAKAHLNDPTALDDLNKVHNRAGLVSLAGLSGQSLIDAILKERRFEFFAESGLRWHDLKRTGQLNAVIGALKPSWSTNAKLFPIPEAEILVAPNLIQNPGYN